MTGIFDFDIVMRMRLTPAQVKRLRAAALNGPNKVRLARELAELTQVEMAKALHCEQNYISKIECDKYSRLPLENARELAAFFGCHIEDLFPAREAVAS